MRISASTLAIEWARKAERKYGHLLDSKMMPRKEVMEMAFFAGYKLAEQDWRKKASNAKRKAGQA
jgi:hypothetical protein